MSTNQRQCLAVSLLVLAFLCGGWLLQSVLYAKQTADKAKTEPQTGPVDEKTIRALIKQLGDDSFDKREEATKRLAAMGEAVRELVKKAAADSPDAEVRQRAEEILRAIGSPALPVPDPLSLAKKPGPADALKRSDIPVEVLAKMGTGNNDSPNEIVAVLGKAGEKNLVVSLSLTQDGRFLAAGGELEKTVQLFDLKTGQLLKTFAGFTEEIRAVALSPDGKSLAVGGKIPGPALTLWDTDSSGLRAKLSGHSGTVWCLDISPDGKLLASGGYDRALRIWNMETGAAVRGPIAHKSKVNRVAFSPDGKLLASASNGEVEILEMGSKAAPDKLIGQAGEIRGLAWHPDGRSLASASFDGTIYLWDIGTKKSTRVLSAPAKKIQALAWHPTGQFLAANDHTGGAVLLWDLRAPAQRPPSVIQLFTKGPKGDVWMHDLIFTPEGRHLIAGNPDGTVTVLRLAEVGSLIKGN